MAKNLNKSRMRDSRVLVVLTLLLGIFGTSPVSSNEDTHEIFELIGVLLIAICTVGRVYSTAFIGGQKNQKLITWGPYSTVRNPLYFFSLMGAIGLGFLSTHLITLFMISFGFLIIYDILIKREEEFLREQFGAEFDEYAKKTPRLWPSFKNYNCPDELTFQPRYLLNALKDCVWWFAPLAVFEICDILREENIIRPFVHLF